MVDVPFKTKPDLMLPVMMPCPETSLSTVSVWSFKTTLAPFSITSDFAAPAADNTGYLEIGSPAGIIASVVAVGTFPEHQLLPVFQSLLVILPIQVFRLTVTAKVNGAPEQVPEVGVIV